jgi:hypothetical protein
VPSRPSVAHLDAALTELQEAPIQEAVACGRPPRVALFGVEFSPALRDRVLAGDITVSFRLWRRPKVRAGGRYTVRHGQIVVDSVDLVPFAAITQSDVDCAGEDDLETLRRRAAHAGPITDETLLYRIEFHPVAPEG